MPARYRLPMLLLTDALLLCAAGATAIVLRFLESGNLLLHLQIYIPDILLGVIFYLAAFYAFRLYHRVWAYASTGELLAIVGAASCGTAAHMAGAYLFYSDLPRSVLLLTWLFTIIYIGASRLAWRLYIEHNKNNGATPSRRVLIVGAGDAGVMVARELRNSSRLAIKPVGFVDDDQSKQRQVLLGLPVLGTRQDIPALVRRHGIDEIIIAMPSVPAAQIKEIATICTRSCPEVKILPGMYELIDGRVSISRLRRINVEDLLHREPVCLDLEQIAGYLGGKTVLVTGAGGSIGSELCRQAARFGPARLVLLGHGENSIHSIWLELQRTCPDLPVSVEIADVREKERMDRIFARHRPDVVFHAAAHKHVPLMEMHPEEAVKTNLLGTMHTARAADRHGCEIFVFESFDLGCLAWQ